MKSLSTFLYLFLITHFCIAQVSFTDASAKLNNSSLYGGFVMGLVDMNGDHLDDIVRFAEAENLEIEFQQPDGSFLRGIYGPIISDKVWSLAVADVDDNGFNDLITGGFYLHPVLAKYDGAFFELDTLDDGPLIFMQAANFADIDNDGLIDYFACNDDGLSNPYRNDGTTLIHDNDLINSASPNGPVNSGNYGTLWTDYDNDGDLDMYLSKCRLGVNDPMDERRINILFQNDGNNNYTDVADEVGLRPLGQTWAIDFGDIDNDGDMDAFMINHDIGSFLYENDGSHHFTDITTQAGLNTTIADLPLGFQVFFEDFDNDGFMDLLLTSYKTDVNPVLYFNNGDQTFTQVNPFNTGQYTIQSCALGDVNSDGFIDLIAGFANGVNFPNSQAPDIILQNDGNNNNWLSVNLNGFLSNKNGIGAKIEIFGDWGKQLREIRSGLSYGIMNSLNAHFGIGQSTAIDSIVVSWPSGNRTVMENPTINQHYTLDEAFVEVLPDISICQNEEILIFDIIRTEAGTFYDTIPGASMDTIFQVTLEVHPSYDITIPTQFFCAGDSVNGQPIIEGFYTTAYQTIFGCDSVITVDLQQLPSFNYSITTVEPGATQIGSISVENIELNNSPFEVRIVGNGIDSTFNHDLTTMFTISPLTAGMYTLSITDSFGCTKTEVIILQPSGLNDLIKDKFSVFPNPTNQWINVSSEITLSRIDIVNTMGMLISSVTDINTISQVKIDLSKLHDGPYILLMYNEKKELVYNSRIVKVSK